MRKKQDYIFLYVKGIFMGAAEVVPGLSSATVAFMSGVYDELVQSVRSIDRRAFKLLTKFKFHDFWTYINGNFLLAITTGIITSLLSLSRLLTYTLKYHPILIGSFFFALILMSTPLLRREEIKKWGKGPILCFVVGIFVAYALTILPPIHTPQTLLFIFLVGIFAGSLFFIPGLSLTLILILLGQYQFLSSVFAGFNIPLTLVFIAGYLVGLALFSRFLIHILSNYHSATVALLTGFIFGFLNKVWPWREVLEYVTNAKGEQVPASDKSILPWEYFSITGKDPHVFQAILMMALGVFIVILIERIASRLKTKI